MASAMALSSGTRRVSASCNVASGMGGGSVAGDAGGPGWRATAAAARVTPSGRTRPLRAAAVKARLPTAAASAGSAASCGTPSDGRTLCAGRASS